MKFSAVLERLNGQVLPLASSILLAACFTACVNGRAAGPEAAPNADSTSSQLAQATASSRVLSSLDSESLGLELVDSSSASELVVNSSVAAQDISVNRLANPERIVIDIKGSGSKLNRNFDATDSSYLSKVRVGSHPDKTRVVLDLAEGRNIEHEIESRDGRLVVHLSEASSQSPQLAQNNAAVEEEVIAANLPTTSEPEAQLVSDEPITSDSDAVKASPDMESPLLNSPQAQPESTVNTLSIEQIGDSSNMLVADVTSPGIYQLDKTAQSEYVLKIQKAALGENATGIVAPPNSGLIRSVRPVVSGEDVLLRIFAQPGTLLKARASNDKIVVSALSANEEAAKELRAQAAPEKTEAAKPDANAKGEEVTLGAENGGTDSDKEVDLLASSNYTGRLISLDLQDTDIDNALRIIAEVSNLNIIASDDVAGKVTLRLIDVPWDQALDVILKTNGLDKVQEGNVVRIAPVEKLRQEREALKQLKASQDDLEPLVVKYMRISYAKASELKPLVESVISERGVVTYDERSNQIIVKDISAGIRNVTELISRVDLRTPQVLLETQIVEAQRTLSRDLGSELGFTYIQSPETGNATGRNFPNSIGISGSATGTQNGLTSFPADGSSAISFLLGSADGTKELNLRLSALESENRVRIVSRPAVATTNNRPAVIKSVEKIRVKTPQGGLSVATGQGATASGSSAVATEVIEVGIVLEVTPQASPDYYVLLDIKAKSSNFGANPVDGIPSEIERSANSSVLVSSGQTFAMGGIYRILDNDSVEGVPFFKDIPFIGHFFSHTLTDNGDEELLFFITPRIVEGSFDDATMKVS